jgi:hypothetical protein
MMSFHARLVLMFKEDLPRRFAKTGSGQTRTMTLKKQLVVLASARFRLFPPPPAAPCVLPPTANQALFPP